MISLICFASLIGKNLLQRVDEFFFSLITHVVESCIDNFVGNILLVNHETNKHIFVWQFFAEILGIKTIKHVVVFNSRMTTYSLKAAMVVGKYQSVRTNNNTRAIAREVYYCSLQGGVTFVKLIVCQFKTIILHGFKHLIREVVDCPHTFISM